MIVFLRKFPFATSQPKQTARVDPNPKPGTGKRKCAAAHSIGKLGVIEVEKQAITINIAEKKPEKVI